jgi:ankyrin repeat protein
MQNSEDKSTERPINVLKQTQTIKSFSDIARCNLENVLVEITKEEIEKGKGINDINFDNKGNTPLHIACQHGFIQMFEFLISIPGIDINITNNEGNTPLHIACGNGFFSMVDILTSFPGIDINITNNEGSTPLHFACGNGFFSMVDGIMEIKSEKMEQE